MPNENDGLPDWEEQELGGPSEEEARAAGPVPEPPPVDDGQAEDEDTSGPGAKDVSA